MKRKINENKYFIYDHPKKLDFIYWVKFFVKKYKFFFIDCVFYL